MEVRLGIAALLVLASGCGDLGTPQSPQTFRAVGALVIVDRDSIDYHPKAAKGFPCQGGDAFADLEIGSPVVVRDAEGTTVARGKLGQGRLTVDVAQLKPGGSAAGETQGCLMGFAVSGVPDLGQQWSLGVGDREFDFSREDAENLHLVLG